MNREYKPKINENCELYKGLKVKLYKRCDYCSDRYMDCLGTQYNVSMMITFILLLLLPYLRTYPFLFKSAILVIIGICVVLGFLVNHKTDELYLSQFHLKKKTLEMEKLNKDLLKANKELKKLDQLKSDFISTISHEFRSPLTSIKAFSSILLNNKEKVTEEDREDFIRIIDQESDRLTRMINDMLDLSRLEAGKMNWNMTMISINEIITKGAESISSLSMENKILIETDLAVDLPLIKGDSDRLIQVVTNLLSNSIKFTPENGLIKIRTYLAGDNIEISVEDSGMGIPEDELEFIFNKFKQGGDTLTDKPKGTGLGLPICKEIIHAHNGKIHAESRKGLGSTFVFTLPAIPQEKPAQKDQPFETVMK